MSDLQIGLVLLGVALILGVLAFNWWQDRRVRRSMREQFPERELDPLMGSPGSGGRREPGLHQVQAASSAQGDDPDEVDPSTEVVIDVSFAQAVDSTALHGALQSLRQVGSKPVRVFAELEGGGHRAQLRPGERYTSIQLAILLANRSGALSDIEWSQLWTIAQDLAARFDGLVEGPDTEQVLAQAQALDATCAALDAQVGLVLALHSAQAATRLIDTLEQQGFLYANGQLAWVSDTGVPRFTALFDGESPGDEREVQRIELILDLPNSPSDTQAFSRMATVGRDLAQRLGGDLLDDQGRMLPEHTDEVIDQQLYGLYERLEQAGYPAGEARTVRVFS